MKASKAISAAWLAVMLFIFCPAGSASSATLQGLFDGDSLSIGDMFFENWELTGTTPGIDLNKIRVLPFSWGPTN
jgi:hypothetical protein